MKQLLVAFSFLALALTQSCEVPSQARDDCGYFGITQGECESQGCCWNPVMVNKQPFKNDPWCFYPKTCGNYVLGTVTSTPTGFEAPLSLLNEGCNFYGADIERLLLKVDFETNTRLHVKITDADNDRWEIPESIIPRPQVNQTAQFQEYVFTTTTSPFGFAVSRTSGEVIFNTTYSITNPKFFGLVYEDQYLEISTQLPGNANIYGFGERVRPFRLEEGLTYTLWTADEISPVDQNIYGAHPYYMEMRGGKAHGVLFLNSNGLDASLERGHLTYKSIGGVLDFYFFMGPSPKDVVAQYTEFIGRPYFLPYWSLGFQQCKYGYENIDVVIEVVEKYAEANIPLEVMWIDIDYMDNYIDWTFDPVNFPVERVAAFIDDLHSKNQRNVLIVDPGIKNETGYRYWELGLEMDVFMKDGQTGEPLIGMVWPLYTAFPDFTNPRTYDYWKISLEEFYERVDVDGIWIDMNEVASFCYGSDLSTCNYPDMKRSVEEEPNQKPNKKGTFDPNNPPYAINNANSRDPLNRKTTQMDATMHDGTLEYNVHNIYGLAESIVTTKAVEELTGERAFVLSRSTFPGSGAHIGHWTGDNYADWDHLYYSLPGMFNFNIYGIPYVGADICGFFTDTNEELCARWMELGAFYPFARNHNTLGAVNQEPYLWESVAESSRVAINIRYSILPLYYTLSWQAHEEGATIIRPLFFEYPEDESLYGFDLQFLIGANVMVSPVLNPGQTSVDVLFPAGIWYDHYDYTVTSDNYGQERVNVDAPINKIPVHYRGGYITPHQYPAYTLTEARQNDFYLVVALDQQGTASGILYLDDGESLVVRESSVIHYNAVSSQQGGSIEADGSFGYIIDEKLDKIVILTPNNEIMPERILVNGESQGNISRKGAAIILEDLEISMNQPFTVNWQ